MLTREQIRVLGDVAAGKICYEPSHPTPQERRQAWVQFMVASILRMKDTPEVKDIAKGADAALAEYDARFPANGEEKG